MTEEITDEFTHEEMSNMLIETKAEVQALKSVILEILVLLARAEPELMGQLRDSSIHLTQKVADGRVAIPEPAEPHEHVLALRTEMLEAALALAGSPHVGAEIIPLRPVSEAPAQDD